MYAYDFEILKENSFFYLIFDNQKVICSDSDDIVKDKNKNLIQFIIDDFDRCGKLKLDKNKRIKTNKIHCAYHIFSVQKYFIEIACIF